MSAKSAEILEHIAFLKDVDEALTSLLRELRRQGKCADMCNNLHIIAEAEAFIMDQSKQLRHLRGCSDKQLEWIKAAMSSMHPECGVTSDPVSLRAKTFCLQPSDLEQKHESLRAAEERLRNQAQGFDQLHAALNLPDDSPREISTLVAAVKRLKAQVTRLELAAAQPKTNELRQLENWTLEERQAILTLAMQKDMGRGEVLTKKEALTAMAAGKTVAHSAFAPDQWMCFSGTNSLYLYEDGRTIQPEEFWHHRSGPEWETGWRIVPTPEVQEVLPGKPGQSIVVEGGIASYEMVKVALLPKDLPLGTAIRFASDPGSESLITGRNPSYVWLGSATKGVDGAYLMNERAEYRLPGTEDWKPCYNLVNPA